MARIVDPVLQQYCLDVQLLLENINATGMTREEIGLALEGPPPGDPKLRAEYDQRVSAHANERFDDRAAMRRCRNRSANLRGAVGFGSTVRLCGEDGGNVATGRWGTRQLSVRNPSEREGTGIRN
jgi:hypothetical protein